MKSSPNKVEKNCVVGTGIDIFPKFHVNVSIIDFISKLLNDRVIQ